MQNLNYKRQNIYNQKDSALSFLLALIIPQILMLVVMYLYQYATGRALTTESRVAIISSALIPQISMLITFFLVSEKRKANYIKANQINFKINILIVLIVLAIGVVALFGFSPIVNWFDNIAKNIGYTSTVANIDLSSTGKFIASIFYIALLPAIAEELIFRGIITNGLKKYGTTIAVVVSAIFFALMHQNLQQLIYQLFLGGVMAYIVIKTGSILYTMLLHFFNNFVILLNGYLSYGKTQTEIDYSNAWNNIYPFLIMIASVAIIIGLLYLINYVIKNKNKKLNTEKAVAKEQELEQNVTEQNISQANAQQKFIYIFKDKYMIIALVTGVLFWIFAVISQFLNK